jgi:RNA polymerase sigma-70 factor (ECF subfamily)
MIPSEARGAWRESVARLRPYVSRRVASVDVDDVLQETLARVHRGVAQVADSERFGPWVYRVAQSAIADQLRSRARHPLPAVPSAGEPSEPSGDQAGNDDLESELAECVALFVARLPSPYREAVTLTELQGLSQKEAAELLDLSLSGMKSRVQRGRQQIRKMFEECCEISTDCRGRVVECTPRNAEPAPNCRVKYGN